MNNPKQKVIEEFLNDSVTKLKSGLFEWRGRYYEVKYFKQILKDHQASHFIKINHKNRTYGVREVSEALLKSLLTDNRQSDNI